MSVSTMVPPFLKGCWKAPPQWIRLLAVREICVLLAKKHSGTAPEGEPVYAVKDTVFSCTGLNLYLEHDAYLSLRRSEGYGLTMREATLHGIQIVATGWSGNMEFMLNKNCHAVPYRLMPPCFGYTSCNSLNCRWAAAGAAALIQRVRAAGLQQGKAL